MTPVLRHLPTTSSGVWSTVALLASGVVATCLGAWGYSIGSAAPLRATGFGATSDMDFDGLSDEFESILGTNPLEQDSDFDGFLDAEEIARQSDPRDANSFPATNGLSIGQAAFVAGGELRLVTLIYLPYVVADWKAIDMRLGLHTQNGSIELEPAVYAPLSTLTVLPTALQGSIGLRLESRAPASIFDTAGAFAFVATITDQPGTAPKSAAATNLDFVAGVLAAVERTNTSVVAPRNYSAPPGSGPMLSIRPIVIADEVPSAFSSGQICLQTTTEIGFVDGVIELLVDSSNCEEADAYCSPTCSFEAGTTKELVDPFALIGG